MKPIQIPAELENMPLTLEASNDEQAWRIMATGMVHTPGRPFRAMFEAGSFRYWRVRAAEDGDTVRLRTQSVSPFKGKQWRNR